jgi:hypothetical protein
MHVGFIGLGMMGKGMAAGSTRWVISDPKGCGRAGPYRSVMMGSRSMSIVASELRVHRTDGLRVIDAWSCRRSPEPTRTRRQS